MTTPTGALLKYLCMQRMTLDRESVRAAIQVGIQALIDPESSAQVGAISLRITNLRGGLCVPVGAVQTE